MSASYNVRILPVLFKQEKLNTSLNRYNIKISFNKFIVDLDQHLSAIEYEISSTIDHNQKFLHRFKKINEDILDIFNLIDKEVKFQRDIFLANMNLQFLRHEKLLESYEKLFFLEKEINQIKGHINYSQQILFDFAKLADYKNQLKLIAQANIKISTPKFQKFKIMQLKGIIIDHLQLLSQYDSEESLNNPFMSSMANEQKKESNQSEQSQLEQLEQASRNIINSYQSLNQINIQSNLNPDNLNKYLKENFQRQMQIM